MWGGDKNFQVFMMYELRDCENKISLTKVFYCSPFISCSGLTATGKPSLRKTRSNLEIFQIGEGGSEDRQFQK